MKKKKLIPWEQKDSLNINWGDKLPKYVLNGFACPICDRELYDNQLVELLSNPPQTPVICLGEYCDFKSSRCK